MADDGGPRWNNFIVPFLAYVIISGVLAVFFLLYFNRAFASVISALIRTYTWHRYRIYIDVQALQISLLAGRIFFTGLRYHGNNETILVQNGHITWSYWLRRARKSQLVASRRKARNKDGSPEPDSDPQRGTLPCRVNIAVSGVEWFVYNRSPVYSSILDSMTEHVQFGNTNSHTVDEIRGGPDSPAEVRQRQQKPTGNLDSARPAGKPLHDEKIDHGSGLLRSSSSNSTSKSEEQQADVDALPSMLQIFPIHFECNKAAMVLGNENTKAILIVKSESLEGLIDISECQAPDLYRQIFKIDFAHPVLEMRDHEGYKEHQIARAERDKQTAFESELLKRRSFFHRQRRRLVGQLRDLVPYWRSSVESFSVDSRTGTAHAESRIPGSSHWQGLSRYLNDDDDDDKLKWSSVEYAAEKTVVDSPKATLTIFWDVPGRVSERSDDQLPSRGQVTPQDINGSLPPAWAINLSLNGGIIKYGPWADRQRAELQRVFFPSLSKDATPAPSLMPGADRVPTKFDFYLEVDEEVVLQVPTREDSKNWRWKKEALNLKQRQKQSPRRDRARNRKSAASTAAEQRQGGWLSIKVARNATVSYNMDMFPTATGYKNTLEIDLPSTEVTTSVNHSLLWRSGAQHISCDMSTPLKWNGLRTWRFDIDSSGLELFILRDHIILLIDLIDDWGSGPPPEYLLFTPFKYLLNLQLRDLKLYLNVNDVNIINEPINFDDNTYIVLASPSFVADSCISLDTYRPLKNAVSFDIKSDSIRFDLHVPPWNTQATFLASKEIGRLENLIAAGKYHYNSTTSPANTDTLVLDITCQSPTVHLYGFFIRYFLQLKDNYFGDHIHFKTLQEYQEILRAKAENRDAEAANRPPPKKSNDLDVILSIRADDPRIFLPANLYSAKRCIPIEAADCSVDLRFTNYYMDLALCFSPLGLSFGNDDDEGAASPLNATSSTQLYIDGISIYGHRLFGLPPTEPAYLCNWDLDVGAVTGECSVEFLSTLVRGGMAFGFSLDDDENALIPYSSIVTIDVVFLRVFVKSIRIWLRIEDAAFLCSTGTVDVNFNDWARTHYSSRADIRIPKLEFACVNSESAMRHQSRLRSPVETDVFLQTSIHFSSIGRKYDFDQERKLQQEFVRRQDQRTHRAEFLLLTGILDDLLPDPVDPIAQSIPSVPQPVTLNSLDDQGSASSLGSSQHISRLRRQSSFLSMSSSNNSGMRQASSGQGSKRSRPPRRTASDSCTTRRQVRSGMRSRGYPDSNGYQSASSSARGEMSDRGNLQHTTVSFSSQFFPPYFPLENMRPDAQEAAVKSIEADGFRGLEPSDQFGLEYLHPDQLSQDSAHQSLLLDLPSGVTAFSTTASMRCIATLIRALQPTEPEDILDTLQIAALSDIFSMEKRKKMAGSITDFVVRLPHANFRFLNSSDLDASNPCREQQDQYDVSLRTLLLATRTENRTDSTANGSPNNPTRSSFHFRVGSVNLSAAERLADLRETQAAVTADIEGVTVSMGSKDVTYIDSDVGAVRTVLSSHKIEYLAALIHRTNVLASGATKLFSGLSTTTEQRLKRFTYRVITEGQQASDPTFIVRPSAILRAADQHLRINDSWKLITRLRQMWTTLDPYAQASLSQDCIAGSAGLPSDVRQQVMTAFDRWRSWDLQDLKHAVLLNNIFGRPPKLVPESPSVPLIAVARLQEIEVVLDPGPKQNQVFIADLTFRAQEKNRREGPNHVDEQGDIDGSLTLLNVYCSQAGVNLNWEACELVDDVLRLYQISDSSTMQVEPGEKLQPPANNQKRRSYHVAFVLSESSILLDTVNLNVDTRSYELKASLLLTSKSGNVTDTNLILGCDAVTTKVKSHSQALASFRLKGPSVIVAHEVKSDIRSSSHTIRSAAYSQDLKLIVKQDPVVLSEVLDLVVRDEIAQLYELQQKIPSSPGPGLKKDNIVERLSSYRLNLAMFLNSYTIAIPLLRSLTYTISGTVARATMAADFGREIVFDFDIKENSHNMQIRVNNDLRSISLLQIPPTNGQLTSRMAQKEHAITVFASLELVQLDLSAVYSLLTALNRPEITNAIDDLQQQIKTIQEHVDEIFGSSELAKPTAPETNDMKLTYVVHSTLAGVEIFGNSPIKSGDESLARLSFRLDRVHLQVANKIDGHTILEKPDVYVNLREIGFDIEKGSVDGMRSCGNLAFGALITATTKESEDDTELRSFDFRSDSLNMSFSSETVSTFVDIVGYMGDKIKDLDTSRERDYLRKLRHSKPRIAINDEEQEAQSDILDSFLTSIMYSFEIRDIQLGWLTSISSDQTQLGQEDLVLSCQRIEFATRKRNTARLVIEDLQLQMVPPNQDKHRRSLNSALMPEIIFNVAFVSTADARRLAFQAVGKPLDLRLTSAFIIPAAHLRDSIALSTKNVQQASAHWAPIISPDKQVETPPDGSIEPRKSVFGGRRIESLLLDADFAGAVVHLSGKRLGEKPTETATQSTGRPSVAGKYGQFNTDETGNSTVLRTPGLAWKAEYRDNGKDDPDLYGEVKIAPSRNILYPSVVPLILDISSSVKEVVSDVTSGSPTTPSETSSKAKSGDRDNILTADPSAVLGRLKLNLGLRICQQEFTLSCQPIGRVAATARFEDIYLTMNTVHSTEHGNFFALSGTFSKLQTAVQHVYSRESTGSLAIDSIVVSLMNSKHVSGTSGLSAIVKVSPMKVAINVKQLQDFLLFREIWIPREIRQGSAAPVSKATTELASQGHLVQRYQQVAATAAFPWTVTISISALDVTVDLGQSLGKSEFAIKEFWVTSKKTSDWEQNLCLGFEKIGVDCTGRLSGFVALQDFKLRTSIEWPQREQALNETPRVQASVGFSQLRLKASFDYQAFLVADITSIQFLMYNVRQHSRASGDRLVAIFDGGAAQVYGTTTSAAQSVALWQAIQKLIQERKASYATSLRDIEKFMRRKSLTSQNKPQSPSPIKSDVSEPKTKSPISLDTDVVVTLKALNLGVFPNTFSDRQVFKLEALNAQARFAASMEEKRIQSILGLKLGQLRIGLANIRAVEGPKASSEISIEDVVASATGSRGGTILKVPQVGARMQTWQKPDSRHIQYIFKSAFEGKVEVGWNYSRISYIRGMWANHSRALATTWGREIPTMSAIKVTGVPEPEQERKEGEQQQKITAEVNVPQSKYEYEALEPAVVETPQLRDMGEATPPLEWIGLHRDRLPNLTHQIVIVALLEVAGEVEDAYAKILGSS